MSYEAFHDGLRDTRYPLVNGAGEMPAVGFGTLFRDLSVTTQAVTDALEAGFRHFDCAERYRNEEAVGVAFRQTLDSGAVRREDLFVTSKLWNTNHRPERVLPAFEASCRRLQLDDIDCYLIHTPFAFQPGDNQDPRPEWELLEFCKAQGIIVLAFAPLGHGMQPNVLEDAVITGIARRVQKTPAQVALAWAVQRGSAFLTTSATPAHIRENFDLSTLPQRAMLEIREEITTRIRFNSVVEPGVPGFIPRKK